MEYSFIIDGEKSRKTEVNTFFAPRGRACRIYIQVSTEEDTSRRVRLPVKTLGNAAGSSHSSRLTCLVIRFVPL